MFLVGTPHLASDPELFDDGGGWEEKAEFSRDNIYYTSKKCEQHLVLSTY